MGPTLVIGDRVRTSDGIAGDAVRIRSGRIEAIGWADRLRDGVVAEERYPGTTIIPGLGDAHFHPTGLTAALTRLNLAGASSFDEVAHLVEAAGSQLAPGEAIIGTRLDDEHLAEGRMPDRHLLDAASPDRPVLLYRYCGHIASANTAALAAAGLEPATPDPPGGVIDRDVSGAPTGVLRETAVESVAEWVGSRSSGLTPDELNRALRGLVRQGLTRLGAIARMGEGLWCGTGDELELICAAGPEAPLDLSVFVITQSIADLETAANLLASSGRRVSFGGLKVFADGSLGGHTAAMYEPFTDRPGETGTLRLDRARIEPVARAAIEMGGGVAVHAIGDRANSEVLDLMADLRADYPDGLLRIEHASVLRPEDIPRFAELGVVASVQPAFIASETDWLEKRLGPRLPSTYAFESLRRAGATLAGGSDCPVEPPDPMLGIATARDRSGLEMQESLSGADALDMFTKGVSRALHLPDPAAAGARAHLTMVDGDPVDVAPENVRRLGVVATWVEGQSVAVADDALMWT